MVTKGIIKSIDYNGNTCKVRVPILESACDDAEIVLSAIFSTAPGIFNGYKEEDVVIVSFEDNNYENAIILGKLYLGASKENEDPRGTVSCASLRSENQATIPLSSKLVYDAKDKNTANVKGSYNDYKTLADIVDGLQTQKTEIGSINAQLIDTGDSIGARVSKLEKDSTRHEAELIVHADEIDAKVSKEHNDGTQKGLGWNLNEESWRINAYDEVSGKPDLKELNIVTIDRNGMTLNGDLKINGYPSEIVVKYARWAYPNNPPALYKDAGAKGSTDDYVGLYVFKSGKYVLVAEYNKDNLGIIANETIAYEIDADSWLDNEPDRADGEYIWQWTRTFKYEWIDTGALATSYWVSSYEDKIVCITGATGSTGEPATIYWAKLSTAVHTGKNQKSDIEITPYAKTGSAQEAIDTTAHFKYSLDNGASWNSKDWTSVASLQDNKIIILANDIRADNIIVKLAHAYTDPNNSAKPIYNEYETETITYSPLNTPVLDLTNDSDAIAYDDNTILGNSVSSTAVVYLNGSVISGCTFAWTATNCTISGATDSATVTVSAIDDNKSEGTATCRVTLIPNYRDTELVKVFTVAKQYKGNKGTDGPTPTSSTTYYIYSADTPDLDDTKWETDPANLKKPSGGYFCWTKTVTTYSDGKTITAITDGPNKDAAFALAQGKSTNYYSPTAPSVNIQEGDCWFKTISSTDDEYNNEMSDQDQGKLYQCSGFDADGKAIWKDVGGELVANKLTANYINALDITTKKITVLQDNKNEQSQILFKADGTSKNGTVKIGGFDVKNNTLTATDNISANLVQLMPDKILMQATKSAYWLKNTRTIEDAHSTYSYKYLFKYLETAANSGTWEDISKNDYDYRISSKESPENNLVIVPYVEIYAKNAPDSTIFTFYYSYLNSVTPYKYNGNEYEIWIEDTEDTSKKRLLVPYGTTVINDGTYEYPIGTFITETNSTAWTKLDLDKNHTDYSKYSKYIYDNYTTYYDNYESSSSFNNGEYSCLKLKITKDIPTTFNIYLGISSNFNIAQNFDTVIALEPTDKDTSNFEFTEDSNYSFIESTDFILKASTSGNYVSGNLEDLVKVTYPSIVASEENPKYIYIIYVNRNNTKKVTAMGSGTSTTVVDTAGFCVIPKFITYSDSKLSIGSNFKVTPSGQLTAKNAIFEDNVTLIGGGKLGAFELNNNKLSNSAMILDSTGVSLKDYKYLSIGNNKQFRLFKSQIDKSYVDIGGSSTNTKNMIDVSYIQSYNPIIIQKLTPSNNSTSNQSTTSTLSGASILLTATENVVTQYFHITPTVRSITPVVSNIVITPVRPGNFGNNQIHIVHGTGNSIITGARYVIDFKVEVFEKDDKGNKKSEAAKKDYNFTFDAVFSTAISLRGSVIKSCSIRVPKGRSTASTSYSWTIQGVSSYEFKGIKNTGGSTTKEKLILTETFVDTATDTSAIQLKSASIYLNSNTYVNGDILTASDRNLKENIKYLDYYADYSNVFNYLKPVEFNYKNNNLTQFGFIAQDILEALPLLDETKKYSLVVKDNDHYAVDYNSIIALNTLQIKYLTNKISQLETAYNELLKKVEDR